MSIGNRSFIHEVITAAGGKNIFADINDNYPTVSPPEAVAENNPPRVILYPDDHGTAEMVTEQFHKRPGWTKIRALQEERIYGVNSDLFNRPGRGWVRPFRKRPPSLPGTVRQPVTPVEDLGMDTLKHGRERKTKSTDLSGLAVGAALCCRGGHKHRGRYRTVSGRSAASSWNCLACRVG